MTTKNKAQNAEQSKGLGRRDFARSAGLAALALAAGATFGGGTGKAAPKGKPDCSNVTEVQRAEWRAEAEAARARWMGLVAPHLTEDDRLTRELITEVIDTICEAYAWGGPAHARWAMDEAKRILKVKKQ